MKRSFSLKSGVSAKRRGTTQQISYRRGIQKSPTTLNSSLSLFLPLLFSALTPSAVGVVAMIATSASIRAVRLLLIFFFALASLYYISRSYQRIPIPPTADSFTPGGKQPAKPASQFPLPGDGQPVQPGEQLQLGKTKAAFVTLIRNHEIWDIARSIRQIEDRFNRNYHYPWVFLNDVPFTDEFIQVTSALTSGKAKYGNYPKFPKFPSEG